VGGDLRNGCAMRLRAGPSALSGLPVRVQEEQRWRRCSFTPDTSSPAPSSRPLSRFRFPCKAAASDIGSLTSAFVQKHYCCRRNVYGATTGRMVSPSPPANRAKSRIGDNLKPLTMR
jgi:hypothetical protein